MRRIKIREFWPIFAYPWLLLGISVIGVVVYLFAILTGSETWQVYAIAMIIGPIVVLAGLISLFVLLLLFALLIRLICKLTETVRSRPG